MGKFGSFVLGMLVGCAVMYGTLHYHIVKADEGFAGGIKGYHFVPKLSSTLTGTYVDIRGFGFQEWNEHRVLAAAIAAAGKPELVQGVATESLQNVVDGAFGALGVPLETAR